MFLADKSQKQQLVFVLLYFRVFSIVNIDNKLVIKKEFIACISVIYLADVLKNCSIRISVDSIYFGIIRVLLWSNQENPHLQVNLGILSDVIWKLLSSPLPSLNHLQKVFFNISTKSRLPSVLLHNWSQCYSATKEVHSI